MKANIWEHIQNCIKCISKNLGKVKGFIPKENMPFETIHVDHFGPVNQTDTTKKYILLIVDAFTKYVKITIKDTEV